MNLDALYSELTLKTNAKLVLVVLDGLGDIATKEQNYLTPLEAAADTQPRQALQGFRARPHDSRRAGHHAGQRPGPPRPLWLRPAGISSPPAASLRRLVLVWNCSRATFAPARISPRWIRRALSPTAAPAASRPRLVKSYARCSPAKVKKIGDTQVIIKAGKEHRFVVVFPRQRIGGPFDRCRSEPRRFCHSGR